MIDLYTAATPNGRKISIALEELALPYRVHTIDLSAQQQKTPEFLAMNPNGKIPVIVDRENDDFVVFESGAILIYLAEKTGKLLPSEAKKRSQVLQWLMFQMGGLGPMMGQANVWFRYWDEKYQPAINRYQHEVRRLFEVLETRLEGREFLVDEFSIADIANWSWATSYEWSGVSIDGLPNLSAWIDRIQARPASARGAEIPERKGKPQSDDERAKSIRTFVVT